MGVGGRKARTPYLARFFCEAGFGRRSNKGAREGYSCATGESPDEGNPLNKMSGRLHRFFLFLTTTDFIFLSEKELTNLAQGEKNEREGGPRSEWTLQQRTFAGWGRQE